MKISFIVLTYNRTETLLPVLRSLAVQCSAEHEVIVADDGSRADQVDQLFRDCPIFHCQVKHIWHPDTGFTASAARNLGAYFSTGDYLVFLDGDCVPNSSFVDAHSRLAQQACFVNGSRVLLDASLTSEVVQGRMELGEKSFWFWLNSWVHGHSNKVLHMLRWPASLFRLKKQFEWRGIRSCNMAVWRNDFWAVNGFDETFEGWGHEDADLVLRLHHLGLYRKNGFWATEVFHLWHREQARHQESVNRKKVFERMQGNIVIADKGLRQIVPGHAIQITALPLPSNQIT